MDKKLKRLDGREKKSVVRQDRILSMLLKHRMVTVNEFCKELGCSESTVRNDLRMLEEQGLLMRGFGCAVSTEPAKYSESTLSRLIRDVEEKEAIASYIVDNILFSGCSVTLDTGTTCVKVAQKIAASNLQLTVITASFSAAAHLTRSPGVSLFVTGGHYTMHTDSFTDETTIDFFSRVHTDFFILSCSGVTIEHGCSTSNMSEANFKTLMSQQAEQTICAMTSNKFGCTRMGLIMPVEKVRYFVTDWNLSEKHCVELQNRGSEVVVVKRPVAASNEE